MINVRLEDLANRIKQDLERIGKATVTGVRNTARKGSTYAKQNTIPIAFKELREATDVHPTETGARIVTSAPHAAAVEVGSRPHMPPLDPILDWVRLRLRQGTLGGKVMAFRFTTKAYAKRFGISEPERLSRIQSRRVAQQVRRARISRQGGAKSDYGGAIEVAKMIQLAIAKGGTKPSHYMKRTLPYIDKIILKELRSELDKVGRRVY